MDNRVQFQPDAIPDDKSKPVNGTVSQIGRVGRIEVSSDASGDDKPEVNANNTALTDEAQRKAAATNTNTERPSWLPEKFKSPEEFAKAYGELEVKLGTKAEDKTAANTATNTASNTATADEASKVLESKGLSLGEFGDEFRRDGQLSAASYDKLAKAGIDKATVDSYVAGQQALAREQMGVIFKEAGGDAKSYQQMTDWAKTNLSKGEIAGYNAICDSGNQEAILHAVRGIYAKYTASEGKEPNLISGDTPRGGGVKPFESQGELVRAMSDPRYKEGDRAYHNEVQRRLAISKF